MSFFGAHSFYMQGWIRQPGGRIIYDPYQTIKNVKCWSQVKACALRGYNLVSCFASIRDTRELTYGHFIEQLPVNGNGVPFSAKRTLLAQRLRQGYYDSDGIWHRFKEDIRCFRGQPARKAVTRERVKAIDSLRGRLIGVEIEYYPSEEEYMPESLVDGPLCFIGTDGSIGSGGREIRKLTWADNKGRLAGLLGLPLKGTTDERCGLHVHVDCRHLGQGYLLNVVQTYERVIQFYPHLKRLVPGNRLQNKYCRWINNCPVSAGYEDGSRYTACNFAAYDEHRTIEFRMQAGMTNPVAIESWALICQFIVNWAAIPGNPIPQTWKDFVAIFREPLRSWVIMRDRVFKSFLRVNPRVLNAIQT